MTLAIVNEPGSGPYLIRATHQGAGYFIAAPQGNKAGDIGVYDASPKAGPISIEADVLQMEAQNDQLIVSEHWFVHNSSSPKQTRTGDFQFVIPADGVLDMAESTRPSPMAMPTIAQSKSLGNGRYALSVPIEPDQGDKNTIFEIQYHIPYKGKYTFHSQVTMPVDNFAIQLPKTMEFKGEGSNFQQVQAQQQIAIYLMKNAVPGTPVVFTVSGSGTMPREDQSQAGGGPQSGGAPAAGQPGGGIGEPIQAPDPLSKYKWWILGGLALLLAAAAAFLLRKPAGNTGVALPPVEPAYTPAVAPAARPAAPAISKDEALMNALKEELFSLESERISGTISAAEYADQKAALETVLKRALSRK
jgi:hypothetical protein